MARKAPEAAAPPWNPPANAGFSVDIRIVTPMFGGGFEPRAVDEDCPVHAASVRGHLRFWWRATVGAGFATSSELFKAEERLWGSATVHGVVRLDVRITESGSRVEYAALAGKSDPKRGPGLGYLLFPFQADKNQAAASGRDGVRFALHVRCPSGWRAEVERALRAWITLGGVGARTRRGCGALAAEDKAWRPPSGEPMRTWLDDLCPAATPAGNRAPSLAGASFAASDSCPTARSAWDRLARFWARFRKGQFGDGVEYSPMSGSRWRDYTTLERSRRGDEPTIRLAKPYLGLPLIYQEFQDRKKGGQTYGPTVEPADSGRMASPVLLRPVAMADGSFRPVVVVMNAPGPESIKIPGQGRPVKRLAVDPDDPVLMELRSETPLGAVIAAAMRELRGCETFTLGGDREAKP